MDQCVFFFQVQVDDLSFDLLFAADGNLGEKTVIHEALSTDIKTVFPDKAIGKQFIRIRNQFAEKIGFQAHSIIIIVDGSYQQSAGKKEKHPEAPGFHLFEVCLLAERAIV